MVRTLLGGFACVLVGACSPYDSNGAFACTQDSQCDPAGACKAGFCAFPDSSCSSDLRYGQLAGSLSGSCFDSGIDGGIDGKIFLDAPIDSPPGEVCYGAGIMKPCFATAPTGSVKLTADIDTDGGTCATTVNSTGACVIAAGTLGIDAGVTVHAHGSKPLVLVAATTITIAGTLDVASHRAPAQTGAGAVPAGNTTLCDPGIAPGANGGGAGGSFGSRGGAGGGPNASTSGATQTAATARGGCAGQDGSTGTFGVKGLGGGVAYLIADSQISVAGVINASGAAGSAGVNGDAGGGGGGSGGLVGLDSPLVFVDGTVFANGGGGAEGSGNTTKGLDGNEPTSIAAAPAADGGSNGGGGGNGAGDATAAGAGLSSSPYGGGGGGGGIGVTKLDRASSIGGSGGVSPPPS
jgi:hypothetical protein